MRDQGFTPAVRALTDQIGLAHHVDVDLDVEAAEQLAEKTQAALYQIIREAVNQAVHRGPPTDAVGERARARRTAASRRSIADDAPGERRRRSLEEMEERARTLNGEMTVDHGDSGTTVRVQLPPYATRELGHCPWDMSRLDDRRAAMDAALVVRIAPMTSTCCSCGSRAATSSARLRATCRAVGVGGGAGRAEAARDQGRAVAAAGRLAALRVPTSRLGRTAVSAAMRPNTSAAANPLA